MAYAQTRRTDQTPHSRCRLRIVLSKGVSRVGVDEIAAFAGVTKRTLYYHFKSKDELLASVLDLHLDQLWPVSENMRIVIRTTRKKSSQFCSLSWPNGPRSPAGREPDLRASLWSLPTCRVIPRVPLRIAISQRSRTGTPRCLATPRLPRHVTVREKSRYFWKVRWR